MTTTARVLITLDVEANSSWSDDTKLSQVYKQGAEDALGHLQTLINNRTLKARIIGTPQVTAVIHVQDRTS